MRISNLLTISTILIFVSDIFDQSKALLISIKRQNKSLQQQQNQIIRSKISFQIFSLLEDRLIEKNIVKKSVTRKPLSDLGFMHVDNNNKEIERGHIYVQEIPSLSTIKSKLKNDDGRQQQQPLEKYCLLSGGYPNSNVKESVYVNLLAHLSHRLEVETAREERRRLKREVLEDLKTFGLL